MRSDENSYSFVFKQPELEEKTRVKKLDVLSG